MNTRLPTLLAALSIAALLGWLTVARPGETDTGTLSRGAPPPSAPASVLQERSGGSEVPCAVPLAWRIARVDAQFDMSRQTAAAVVEEASRLWEDGSGRPLFEHDPAEGFPVRLVYDDRQVKLQEQTRSERSLAAARAELTALQDVLSARGDRLEAASTEHLALMRELDRRVIDHNDAVRAWNESGDGSEEGRRSLEAAGEALAQERARLEARRADLEAESASLRAEELDLGERIREYERLRDDLEAEFPPSGVEAGEYREAVTRENGTVVSVSREIRLYRFSGPDELRLLAAHELGHALGLGHSPDPDGVMHASARADRPLAAIAASDLDLLERVCPRGERR